MKLLARSISVAASAFEDKLDAGGSPYVLHLIYVMNAVRHLGEKAMCAAVLHDYIEDISPCYIDAGDELRAKGVDDSTVIANIYTLTHKEDEDYDTYIKRIACSNEVCVSIKLADLEHNSNITRMKGLTKKDFDRLEKYCRAYEYLKCLKGCM